VGRVNAGKERVVGVHVLVKRKYLNAGKKGSDWPGGVAGFSISQGTPQDEERWDEKTA